MRRYSRHLLIALLMFLTVSLLPAYASTTDAVQNCSNCNGYSFDGTLSQNTNGSYTLLFHITNNNNPSTPNNALAYNWSLTMFGNNSSVGSDLSNTTPFSVTETGTSTDYTTSYVDLSGKSNNGNSNCNSSVSGAVCVEPSGNGSLAEILPGQTLSFTFSFICTGTCAPLSSWTFLASGNQVGGHGNAYAISTNGVAVPEPSMVSLLGAEMLAIFSMVCLSGGVRRKWLRKHPYSGGA